jgi:hypothetical protein
MNEPLTRPRLNFWNWWKRIGENCAEEPKFLAQLAFDAGVAQSGNYTADESERPWIISFACGKTVSIAFEDGEPYLEVSHQEQLQVYVQLEQATLGDVLAEALAKYSAE